MMMSSQSQPCADAEEIEDLRRALADISIRSITGQHFETLEYKNREFAKIEALALAALSKASPQKAGNEGEVPGGVG